MNPLQWRHNWRDGVSGHQLDDCLLNRLFRRRSKKTSKLRVTGLCARNSPVTGEFPAQMASNAENVSILWRHRDESIEWVVLLVIVKHFHFQRGEPYLSWQKATIVKSALHQWLSSRLQ